MDLQGAAILAEWLAERATVVCGPTGGGTGGGTAPVFCTIEGKRLSESYLRRRFPLLAANAGIDKRVHAHGFRHTHAAELRAEGVDIGIISKQLGHAAIDTAARYLDHIAPWAVVRAREGRTW